MKKSGFTLIELIVVITILAILGTIAFISFKGYSSDARNSVRTADLTNIKKGLSLNFAETGNHIAPSNSKTLTVDGKVIGEYGTVGDNVLTSIGISGGGKDPLSGSEYYYSVSGKEFNVVGFFEGLLSLNTQAVAEDLSDKSYKIFGDSEVYLTKSDLTPIDSNISNTDSSVDLIFLKDSKKQSISSSSDIDYYTTGSCEGLYDFYGKRESGTYTLEIGGVSKDFYCNMDLDIGPSIKLDTLFNVEADRDDFGTFFATNYNGPSLKSATLSIELGGFPQYLRNVGSYKQLPEGSNNWYCSYKLNKEFGTLLNPSKIDSSFEGISSHKGRDGLFIATVARGSDGNSYTDDTLGVRSESEVDYDVYKEIYCNY